MNLVALPAFTDNYIWMLHDERHALVVDPGDAAPVREALSRLGLELAAILVTHHHADHVGGVDELRPLLKGLVYGPWRERIPQPFEALNDGDTLQAMGVEFRVIDVPGHTAGHIAYYAAAGTAAGAAPLLFCGDTLFSAGCGRLFEGTPAQMHDSLAALAALPGGTRVCCTHEYTLSNLRVAAAAEPGNPAIAQHTAWCEAERAAGRPTLPSTLARELQINPFLRCSEPELVRSARTQGAEADDTVSVLAALREWKNRFR